MSPINLLYMLRAKYRSSFSRPNGGQQFSSFSVYGSKQAVKQYIEDQQGRATIDTQTGQPLFFIPKGVKDIPMRVLSGKKHVELSRTNAGRYVYQLD